MSSGSKTVQKEVGKRPCQPQSAGPGRPTEQHVCLSTKGQVQIKEEKTECAGTLCPLPLFPKASQAGPQGQTQPRNLSTVSSASPVLPQAPAQGLGPVL